MLTSRSGSSEDSVVDVSRIVTLDKRQLGDRAGALDFDTQIEVGLRFALDLAS